MKKISLFLLSCVMIVGVNAQQLLFEDFQNTGGVLPAGWQVFDNDASSPNISIGPEWDAWHVDTSTVSAILGDSVVTVSSWLDPIVPADDWLITPAVAGIDATSVLNWLSASRDADYLDAYEVYVSTVGTVAGMQATTPIFTTAAEPAGAMNPHTFNLAAYAGQTIYVGFHLNGTDAFILEVDDIEIINNPPPGLTNDDCSGAISIPLATNMGACAPMAGTTVTATQSTTPTDICSASWFADDVWYSFMTGATVPTNGVTVQAFFDNTVNATDVAGVGMAAYAGCAAGELAIACFSGANDQVLLPPASLAPNTTYYIRVWSAGNQVTDQGTFTICAYGADIPVTACNAGVVDDMGPHIVCPGGTATVSVSLDTVPTGGAFGWIFSDSQGGTGGFAGGFTLTGATTPYTFDSDLNGVLSANNLLPLSGVWVLYGLTYTDPADFANTICSVTTDSITVNFLASAPTAGTLTGSGTGCHDGTLTATIGTPPNVPAGTTQYYALTQGTGLTVVAINTTPTFDLSTIDFATLGVPDCGTFTIHSAVVADDVDLSFIVPGTTTGLDVAAALSTACGALDAVGAAFNVSCEITVTTTSTPEACGSADGTASASAAGGTAPFTYAWSNGTMGTTAMGLSAGTHNVTTTDANGCTSVTTANVGSSGGPNASITSTTDASCNGGNDGSIDITVTGGATPYTYAWSSGSADEDPMGLAAGTYNGTITDANGCAFVVNAAVVGEPVAVSATVATTDASCNGASDGSISITPAGGTAPYTYSWSNGSADEDPMGLSVGSYDGTITDANGCTFVTTGNMVGEPDALGYIIDFTQTVITLDCFGDADGALVITTTGGTAPYTYTWSNGEVTEDITGLMEGNYQGTITDANGCTLVSPPVPVQAPDAISLTGTTTAESVDGLDDGAIDITTGGGTTPFSYVWDNGAITEDLTDLADGTYCVTVTDDNGCTEASCWTVDMGPPSGVDDIDGLNSLTVNPNPTSGDVMIDIALDHPMNVKLDLYSVNGQLLQSFEDRGVALRQYNLDLSQYSGGVYMARLTIDNQVTTRRIALMK